MTTSTHSPEPTSSAPKTPPLALPEATTLQPQLQLVSGLLSRLLERLEVPSGDAAQQIAEMMSSLSAMTQSLARAAEAMERISAPEGTLGQIGADLHHIAAKQEAQAGQIAVLSQQMTTIMDWLAGESRLEDTSEGPRSPAVPPG